MDQYFTGEKLYGDDFSQEQIKQWFNEEREGYAGLSSRDDHTYQYAYHALNKYCGYRHLDLKKPKKLTVLSIGGAFGDELLPIISHIQKIIILEPSEKLRRDKLDDIKINYLTPSISGAIALPDQSIDLITCFGVLHHIPNVSFVMSELSRVLKPGSNLLIREPIVSMGNWQKPRKGLTKNERGIPIDYMRMIFRKLQLQVVKQTPCLTKPFDTIYHKVTKKAPYNSSIYVRLDQLLARLLFFNYSYHPKSKIKKFRPSSCFFVLKK